MGSITNRIDSDANPKDEVLAYVRQVAAGATVIDHSFKSAGRNSEWGGVGYFAIRKPDGQVWALVVLFAVDSRRGDRILTIRPIDETMGPNEVDAPARLMKKLTPTDDDYALQWRERVHQARARHAAAKSAIGSVITLGAPLNYGSPVGEVSTVRVESLTLWVECDSGVRLRPPTNWWLREFTAA